MLKWIVLVLVLVAGSVMTSGLVSSLLDLAAFVVLLVTVVVVKKSGKHIDSEGKLYSIPLSASKSAQSHKIDIEP